MENDDKQWRRPSAWKLDQEIHDKIHEQVNARIHENIRRKLARRRCHRPGGLGGFVPGVILLALGLIFLLDSFGYVRAHTFLQFWPMILVLVGISKISRRDSQFWGAMLLLFGIFLQLSELGIGHFTWGQFWPLLLIAAGAMALWSAVQARQILDRSAAQSPNAGGSEAQSSDPRTTLDESTIFGGIEKRFNGREFRGGRLQAVFGGIEIDLRDAEMAENEAVIYANAMFGGIEIRVPESWYVASRGQGVFGGFNDSTRYLAPTDPDKPKKTLVVAGTSLFGGVEIRN